MKQISYLFLVFFSSCLPQNTRTAPTEVHHEISMQHLTSVIQQLSQEISTLKMQIDLLNGKTNLQDNYLSTQLAKKIEQQAITINQLETQFVSLFDNQKKLLSQHTAYKNQLQLLTEKNRELVLALTQMKNKEKKTSSP